MVAADINGNWLVNQWTTGRIVIEGVAQNVLMQQKRTSNRSGRMIGYHFARVGLPQMAFGRLFNTLRTNFPRCLCPVVDTDGYHWMNASWGLSSFQGTFLYKGMAGVEKTTILANVTRMLNGTSALCLGTLSRSLSPAWPIRKPTSDTSAFGLSVKPRTAFSIDVVNYHGPCSWARPAWQSATGS